MKHLLLLAVLIFSGAANAVVIDKTCKTETGVTFSLSMDNNSITVNGTKRQIFDSKCNNDPQTLEGYTDYWAGENGIKHWNYVNAEIEHDTGKVIGFIAISPQPALSYECK